MSAKLDKPELELRAELDKLELDLRRKGQQLQTLKMLQGEDTSGFGGTSSNVGMNEISEKIKTLEAEITKGEGQVSKMIQDLESKSKSAAKSKAESEAKSESNPELDGLMATRAFFKEEGLPTDHIDEQIILLKETSADSPYGKYTQSIQAMQQEYPDVGGHPITWYQATPNGSCFFISVDAAMRKLKNAHTGHSEGAKQLRRDVVEYIPNFVKTSNPNALAFEMADILPSDILPSDIDPSAGITKELLSAYQAYMSQDSSWAGQIEVTIAAKLIKRPILIYKLNSPQDRGNIYWYDGRNTQNFTGEYSQFGNDEPIILGHINSSVHSGHGTHYIYALFDNELQAAMYKNKRGKKTKKRKRPSKGKGKGKGKGKNKDTKKRGRVTSTAKSSDKTKRKRVRDKTKHKRVRDKTKHRRRY